MTTKLPVGTITDGAVPGIIHIDGWHCLDNNNGCPACAPCGSPCPVCIGNGDQDKDGKETRND